MDPQPHTMTKILIDQLKHSKSSESIFAKTSSSNFNYFILTLDYIFYAFYAIMSFFKQPTGDPELLVTATLGIIKLIPYSVIEFLVILILLGLFGYTNWERRSLQIYIRFAILVFLAIISIGFNIKYFVYRDYIAAGLIVRPIFLTVYRDYAIRIMMKYLIILWLSKINIIILWIFIWLFAMIGMKFFQGLLPPGQDTFPNLWDSMWNIVVLSYPSVGLKYQVLDKPNLIYFVITLFLNSIVIRGVISADIFVTYSIMTDQENLQQSVFGLLFELTNQNLLYAHCKKTKQQLTPIKKKLVEILEHKYTVFTLWLYKVILFSFVCLHKSNQAYKRQSAALVVINIIILLIRCTQLYIYKLKFWQIFWFDIFQAAASFFSIATFIVSASSALHYDVYTKLIILLLPSMVKYPISFLLELSNAFLRFLERFREIVEITLILSLLFAGIGEIAFGGLNIKSAGSRFTNANYVYLNFNNTVNSMITLFTCLLQADWIGISKVYEILCGSKLVRFYFGVFFVLGALVAMTLFLSLIIGQMISDRIKFKFSLEYRTIAKNLLKYKQEINEIKQVIIKNLRKIHNSYRQVYQTEIPQAPTPRFPQLNYPAVSKQNKSNKINSYSFIYFPEIEQMTFESVSKATDFDKIGYRTFNYLNKLVSELDIHNQIRRQKYSAKVVLADLGIQISEKVAFLQEIRQKLQQLKIRYTPDFQQNMDEQFIRKSNGGVDQIRSLIEHHALKNIDETTQRIFTIEYDLPDGYCRNVYDVYINRQRVVISFRHYLNHVVMKVKVNKIANIFGIRKGKINRGEMGEIIKNTEKYVNQENNITVIVKDPKEEDEEIIQEQYREESQKNI